MHPAPKADRCDHIPDSDALAQADAEDDAQLRQFGYLQQLRRSMGGFSSFAISFSLISICTGIFANFGMGLREVGPGLLWSWSAAVIGQFLVALIVAELALHMPLSGYGYQWSARLVNPHVGFFVGWLLLLQYLFGFPGICLTLGVYLKTFLAQFLPDAQADWLDAPWITVGVMTIVALIHLAGIRPAALVNDAGVLFEIAGSLALTVVLLVMFGWQQFPWTGLFESVNFATSQPAGASSWALSLLVGAWCITGFEGAADLAEETHRPRETVPRAVIASELSSGIGGFFMIAAFLLAIGNLSDAQSAENPLYFIILTRLGRGVASAFMLVVFVAIFACGVASLAHTTRLVFALARDNMLPGSWLLKRVGPHSHVPAAAIVVVWLVSCGVVLSLGNLERITAVATVTGYLGYGAIVITLLVALKPAKLRGGFSLGRWRRTVGLAALGWTALVVGALTIPADAQGGHSTALGVLCALAAGVLLYFLLAGPRIRAGRAGPPTRASD